MPVRSILITGASGLLGANMLLTAHEAGWTVTPVTNQHPLRGGTTVDLTDSVATQNLVAQMQPNWIVHCAAAANVDWCEDHPAEAQRINVDASAALAHAANRIGAGMVHISTDAVFHGDDPTARYREADATNPPSVYAITKKQAEDAVLTALPSAIVLRVNFYGWNFRAKHSLAEWMLSKLEHSQRLPGFADVTFCPMLANDLCDVILALIDHTSAPPSGVFHAVGGEGLSKYEFARCVARTFGLDENLIDATSFRDVALRAPRSPNLALDVGKIEQALGRKMPDVMTGLRKFKHLREAGFVNKLKGL